MELEDNDFAQIVAEVVMEFGWVKMRREATQQAVDNVVERVGRFNGDKVPFYLDTYNAEMEVRGVNEALRLEVSPKRSKVAARRLSQREVQKEAEIKRTILSLSSHLF